LRQQLEIEWSVDSVAGMAAGRFLATLEALEEILRASPPLGRSARAKPHQIPAIQRLAQFAVLGFSSVSLSVTRSTMLVAEVSRARSDGLSPSFLLAGLLDPAAQVLNSFVESSRYSCEVMPRCYNKEFA
jgi:hypothetical protein